MTFLEGGTEEGDWGELDFALEAAPIVDVDGGGEERRREEPLIGLSGRLGGEDNHDDVFSSTARHATYT